MTPNELVSLSFAELRDQLKARIDSALHGTERRDDIDDSDLENILRHLLAVPLPSCTSDTTDALIHLASNFSRVAQPASMFEAASRASQMAITLGERLSLCRARNKEGFALTQLGRVTEATVAQAEAWSLARELGAKEWEVRAIWGFSTICVTMGQWNVALRYCELMRVVARDFGFHEFECVASNNVVDCAIQLRDPTLGLRMASESLTLLSQGSGMTGRSRACFHMNLGRVYLLLGDIAAAESQAAEGARYAAALGHHSIAQSAEAVCGLVSVRLGDIDAGLAKVNRSLAFAKRDDQHTVPDALSMCIDAYDAAGDFDRALAYLQELVDWKKQSIDAQVNALQFDGLGDALKLETGDSLLDEGLVAKAHSLQAGVRFRIDRLLEIAINAEVGSGHDTYRPFRLAKLARQLAEALMWDRQRLVSLALGAQLCNIGMIAIPSRILLMPKSLSDGERHVIRDHAHYGAQLLRKSKLQILDMASVVAEQHHERYDGSGYPAGVSGNDIAEEARIVGICDAFDAMTHQRPWRSPLSVDAALDELERGKGKQFEAHTVDVFTKLVRSMLDEHGDLDEFLSEDAAGFEYVRARAKMEALMREHRSQL